MEHVANLDGLEVWDNTWKDDEIESFEQDRSYGRSRPVNELQDFVKRHKNVSPKFYVHKNPKKKGLESDYLTKPFCAESETEHTVAVGAKTFHKKQLADVTKLVGQHPEVLQEEKKMAGQATTKTERDAVRSLSTGQFHTPEKTVPEDVIPHGVAVGPPGTKGANSHRSQSWKEAKKAAEEKKKAAGVAKSKEPNAGQKNEIKKRKKRATLSIPSQV